MIALYGSPMRASRKVPVVFDADDQVGIVELKGTVEVSGSYSIVEEDLDGLGGVDETRTYTGTVSGTSVFTIPRITLDPRYLNSSSAFYAEPAMDAFSVIRHPRWLFPSFGTGTRGSPNSAMSLVTAVLRWNDDSPFSPTPITDSGNLTINVTRETVPPRASPPYDDNLDKDYHDTLGGYITIDSSRGKLIWAPQPVVNNGTDYPATGAINSETYKYASDPYPSPGPLELITDIHRTELETEQVYILNQPSPADTALPFFTRTYGSWSSTWTFKLQGL